MFFIATTTSPINYNLARDYKFQIAFKYILILKSSTIPRRALPEVIFKAPYDLHAFPIILRSFTIPNQLTPGYIVEDP